MIPAFVNPAAARGKRALAALARRAELRIHPIDGKVLADDVASVIDRGARRIVIAGGDGSISRVAAVVAGTSVHLGVVPAGTLNHFAKDLALPRDLDDATRIAATATTTRSVDVGLANERLFLNTSSIGAYVRFVRVRERLEPRLGYRIATIVAAVRLLARLPLFAVEIEAAGERRHYVTPLVFVGVGERELRLPTLGGRVEGGRPGLHVIVVRGRTGARLFALALAAAVRGTRSVARGPRADAFLVERCRIELPNASTRIAVDGEIVETDGPVEYRLWSNALHVVVGEATESAT